VFQDIYIEASLGKCKNEKCGTMVGKNYVAIGNQVVTAIRRHVQCYYAGWLKCEDSACGTRTRKLPLMFQRGHPICPSCSRAFLHPEVEMRYRLRPKNPVFRATRPYLSKPADPRFFYEIDIFFVGVFIIEVSILKNKNRSRPYLKFLRSLPETQDFFVWPYFNVGFVS